MVFPLNGEEKMINARQNQNNLMARPSVAPPFQRGSTRPQTLTKSENSNIGEDNWPSDDLSQGDLTTLKSTPKQQGMSH